MKAMLKILLVLLCLAVFFGSVASADLEGNVIEIPWYTTLTGRNGVEVLYSPEMFLHGGTHIGTMDPDIAKLSVVMADAAYNRSVIRKMLSDMQCDSIEDYDSYSRRSLYSNDKVAFTIAHISYKGKNIYIVPIRGTTNNEEWFSNFRLHGNDCGDFHYGFYTAAKYVYDWLSWNLERTPMESNIVLLTGHSRGAAVSNIVGGLLMDNGLIVPSHMFCYNYATPAVGKNLTPYTNIFNMNNEGDLITMLPRSSPGWNYRRYGIDISIGPFEGEKTRAVYELMLDGIAENESDYEDVHFAFDILAHYLIYKDVSINPTDFRGYLILNYTEDMAKFVIDFLADAIRFGFEVVYASLNERILGREFKIGEAQAGIHELRLLLQDYDWEDETIQTKLTEINAKLSDVDIAPINTLEGINIALSLCDELTRSSNIFESVLELYCNTNVATLGSAVEHAHLQSTYISAVNRRYCGYKAFVGSTLSSSEIKDIMENAGTTIGPHAFEDCTGFDSFEMPDNIIAIGSSAFENCTGLTDLEIPNNVFYLANRAFEGCNNITSVKLPVELSKEGAFTLPNVETIHYTANSTGVMPDRSERNVYNPSRATFNTLESYSLSHLRTVAFDEGVTHIGDYAFALPGSNMIPDYCTPVLESVSLPSTLKSIGHFAFYNQKALDNLTYSCDMSVICGSMEKSIGNHAFAYCINLSSFPILSGTTEIGEYAFDHCDLHEIELPDGLQIIGKYAFSNNSAVCYYTLPSSVTYIGDHAFSNIKNQVTEFIVPDYADYVGASAFEFKLSTHLSVLSVPADFIGTCLDYCPGVDNLYISPGPTGVIPDYDISSRTVQDGAKNIIIKEGVKRIGAYFIKINNTNNRKMTITLPDSLEYLEDEWIHLEDLRKTPPALINPIPVSLKYIGSNCYFKQASLSDVNLPNTVYHIGEGAFSRSNLTSITIPEGITEIADSLFFNCNSLCEVHLPDSVTTIGEDAFYGTYNLPELVLPSNLQSINRRCFASTGIRSFILPDAIREIPDYAFYGSYTRSIIHSDQISSIGEYAFASTWLTAYTLPETITELPKGVFDDCHELKTLNLHDNLTSIGEYCFAGIGLTEMVFPQSLTSIPDHVLSGCPKLESVYFPDSVTSFGNYLFSNCGSSRIEIRFPASLDTLPEGCFHYCLQLEEYTVPETIKHIGNSAFYECSALKNIVMHDGLLSIGDTGFYNTSISNLTLPESVTGIGRNAFSCCEHLFSVTIPESVASISGYAFSNCDNLQYIYFMGMRTAIGNGLLYNNDTTIYCYQGSDAEIYADNNAIAKYLMDDKALSDLITVLLPTQLELMADLECCQCDYSIAPSGMGLIGIWASSDPSVLTVDQTGKLTIVSPGVAVISLTCEGITAQMEVSVFALATDIILPDQLILVCNYPVSVGATTVPKNAKTDLTYTVDSSYITVDNQNRLVGKKPGESIQLTVTDQLTGIQKSTLVDIWNLTTDISLYRNPVYMVNSGTAQLEWVVFGKNHDYIYDYIIGGLATFSSDNPQVVEVDEMTGFMIAHSEGSAIIIARTPDGIEETTTVIVSAPIKIPRSTVSIEDEAFYGTASYGYIIPDGVISIGSQAFGSLEKEEARVYIPSSVKSIAPDAFDPDNNVIIVAPKDSYAYSWAEDEEHYHNHETSK